MYSRDNDYEELDGKNPSFIRKIVDAASRVMSGRISEEEDDYYLMDDEERLKRRQMQAIKQIFYFAAIVALVVGVGYYGYTHFLRQKLNSGSKTVSATPIAKVLQAPKTGESLVLATDIPIATPESVTSMSESSIPTSGFTPESTSIPESSTPTPVFTPEPTSTPKPSTPTSVFTPESTSTPEPVTPTPVFTPDTKSQTTNESLKPVIVGESGTITEEALKQLLDKAERMGKIGEIADNFPLKAINVIYQQRPDGYVTWYVFFDIGPDNIDKLFPTLLTYVNEGMYYMSASQLTYKDIHGNELTDPDEILKHIEQTQKADRTIYVDYFNGTIGIMEEPQ